MALGLKVITPDDRVRTVLEVPDSVSVEDTVAVLEAEHRDCEIVIASISEAEPAVSHSHEVGDYVIDATEPTPSMEVNTVYVEELIESRADEYTIEETGKTVAEHNPHYPSDDAVVAGTYPNMSSDKTYHFPESRLRRV